jgi:hypothetical protein
LLKDTEIQKILPLIEAKSSKSKTPNMLGRSTTQVADGVVILTDVINKITVDETITRTFKIETPALETSSFENFLVKKYNNQFTYFLISYKINVNATEKENLYKKVVSYQIAEEYINASDLNLSARGDALDWVYDNEGGGGGDDGDCEGVLDWDYSPCEAGNSSPHPPWCQHFGDQHGSSGCSYMCRGNPVLYLDFSHCSNYQVPDGPSGDNTNENPNDNQTSGGGTNNNDDGDSTVTSPVELEDPRCPPGSGKVMIDDVCVCPPNSNKIEDANGVCNCPEGKIENASGICVEDPCRYIKLQIQNPVYTAQANELKTKTGLNQETGYKQNKDGTQVALNETNGGHSLTIPIDINTVGYMHTHINGYNAGDLDSDGVDDFEKPIKMFSPADLLKFLQIVKNSKYNGVPTHLTYGTMISSSGNYTLRFTGVIDDIDVTNLKKAAVYKNDYKRYFEQQFKSNKERAFLHFLKDHININGIDLYRIRDNGDVEKKTLKENGRVDTSDCE